jgi:hypothetical protein
MQTESKIIGSCPLCGGNVVKTCKGYRCEHNIGESPTCPMNINGIIGNRKMCDEEVATLLEKGCIMLDGFATKEGKAFPAILTPNTEGGLDMNAKVCDCPVCGGELRVGSRAFNCINYNRENDPCTFSIWRNIGGHQLTMEEVREICQNGITTGELEMYRDNGSIYRKKLGLSPDKHQIIKI